MTESAVSLVKRRQLCERMARLGIVERDLAEQFVLGSGSGGQKINKTSSCVRLGHAPSGLSVKCQESRSREENRFRARRILCDLMEERILGEKSKRKKEAEKIRRQKRRRSRRQKEKMLEGKRRQSNKKKLRATPDPD